MITDPVLLRIGAAVTLRPGAAREVFTQVWAEIGGEQGDPLHVCVLAHSMADVQDDVRQELLWDQRALTAADHLTQERVAAAGVPMSVAALYPSLHLNMTDCYRKLGDLDRARDHLEQARAGLGALPGDEYGKLIRSGFATLEKQLGEA